jgi:hypothetical protein
MNAVRDRIGDDILRLTLVVIGALTVVSGAVQLVAPGFVLGLLSAETSATAEHLFATVGMFMVVVGGLLVHALLSSTLPAYVLLWAGAQKFGAFALVGAGVLRDVFAPLALLVALFDLATAGVCVAMWWRETRQGSAMAAMEPAT